MTLPVFQFLPHLQYQYHNSMMQLQMNTTTTTTHLPIPFSIPSFISNRFSSPSSLHHYSPLRVVSSKRNFRESQQNGGGDNNNKGDKSSTDWDKAWSNFKKQGRKSLFSNFSPDKYVSWNPRRSEFPISEEVDPIKRTERSNLQFWNSPTFTLGGAVIIVTFLILYTLLAPIK